jgi:hypothetical protein
VASNYTYTWTQHWEAARRTPSAWRSRLPCSRHAGLEQAQEVSMFTLDLRSITAVCRITRTWHEIWSVEEEILNEGGEAGETQKSSRNCRSEPASSSQRNDNKLANPYWLIIRKDMEGQNTWFKRVDTVQTRRKQRNVYRGTSSDAVR